MMVTAIRQLPPTKQSDNEVGALSAEIPIDYIDADLAPTMPDEILLGSLRDGRLKIHSPINVKFAKEGKHVIAEAVEINEFGFGESISEALIDLQQAIAELYLTLEEKQDHLGTDLQGVWSVLQQKIHKR
jgi:hypothetical protein